MISEGRASTFLRERFSENIGFPQFFITVAESEGLVNLYDKTDPFVGLPGTCPDLASAGRDYAWRGLSDSP
jgi:hypothetical protein